MSTKLWVLAPHNEDGLSPCNRKRMYQSLPSKTLQPRSGSWTIWLRRKEHSVGWRLLRQEQWIINSVLNSVPQEEWGKEIHASRVLKVWINRRDLDGPEEAHCKVPGPQTQTCRCFRWDPRHFNSEMPVTGPSAAASPFALERSFDCQKESSQSCVCLMLAGVTLVRNRGRCTWNSPPTGVDNSC